MLPPLRTSVPIALLALALLVPASASAQTGTVAVKGSATQKVPNDSAGLGFSVRVERKARTAALSVASARLQAVIAAVQAVPGVGAGDVVTGRISVRGVTRGKRTLYRASQGISVILHQADRAGELVSAAIGAGATGTRGPRFFPGDPGLAFDNALIAAFDRAKAKATALATRAGATLGPAISIEEGTDVSEFTPTSKSPDAAAEPAPPTKPGTSTVTATVRVVFALL
jgi:uncharacterized protein